MPVPAIPPNDYEGTISDWTQELKERGHLAFDADVGSHVEVLVSEEEYRDILETCEERI